MRAKLRYIILGVSAMLAVAAAKPNAGVSVAFRNAYLRMGEGIVLEVRHLEGALVSTKPGTPPVFDNLRSYRLQVDSGEMAMTPASLTNLLNQHVFAYEGSHLSDLEVSIENGRIKQKGKLHKGVTVSFTVLAEISATPDGLIRLHPTDVKTAGIPAEGLMKMFGVELDDLIKSNRSHGVQIVDNDFLLDPTRLLPEPGMTGHLTSIKLEPDHIVQQFGAGTRNKLALEADRRAKNYLYFRGNQLRFGRLLMSDTDMQLIDADPGDPFDFYPAQYVKQLVAGYSKNTPSGALRVYMPDFDQAAGADLRPSRVLH
jgi:hypothetical protein